MPHLASTWRERISASAQGRFESATVEHALECVPEKSGSVHVCDLMVEAMSRGYGFEVQELIMAADKED